ncbi:PEPxxWA-CTERM sorting domain-containing protein [Sphingomonas sp. RS6]
MAIVKSLVLGLLLIGAAPARSQELITFDDLATPFGGVYSGDYESAEVRFTSSAGFFFINGILSEQSADRSGGAALGLFRGYSLFIDSPTLGYFDLISMDVADITASASGTSFTYLYASRDGDGSGVIEVEDPSGISHLTFDLHAVSFFMLTVTNPDGLQIDNVVAGVGPIGPAVPEPAGWAMLLGGAGLTGGMLRRRHRRAALA